MPKTRITATFEIPTTSMSRVQDVMVEVKKAVDDHKGSNFFVTIQGPYADDYNEAKTNGTEQREDSEERSSKRSLGGRDGSGPDDGKSVGDDGSDGDKPKRGRGRPRKSADDGSTEAPGPSSRKRQRDDEDGDGSEDARGNEPKRTREGSDEGSGQGEGRSRGSERSEHDQRGNREAPRVSDDGDDWGDDEGDDFEDDPREAAAKSSAAWPDSLTPKEIDKALITKLLSEHYNATGGKDRTLTFDLMEDVTGTRKLGEVADEDYKALAKALLKDIARYEFGVKKAK